MDHKVISADNHIIEAGSDFRELRGKRSSRADLHQRGNALVSGVGVFTFAT